MSRKIVGITVGTPMNPQALVEKTEQAKQIEELTKQINELEIPTDYAKEDHTHSEYLTEHQDLSAYAKKSELPTVPTKVSAFENDSGYLTGVPTASASTLGGVKIGSNISISDGKISVPVANGTSAGVTIVYPAQSCTTFSSDSGTVTPLAVQKGAKMFAITRPSSSTNKAITRYSNTSGDVQDSKIIIEDVTNTKDSSKKAQVIAIPAEGNKKMVYGYCTDQVDGTSFIGGVFDKDANTYPYSAGLAIGGTSGSLLWKGQRVLDNSDLTTINSAINGKVPTSRTVNGKALSANIALSASDVGAYSKTEIDSMELITLAENDIDELMAQLQ